MNWQARQGMTLIELLVVIAVIGVLLTLLLPALQMVQEASRTASCQNNLHHIGLAISAYHQAFDSYPPGNVTKTAGICYGDGHSGGTGWPSDDGANWCLSILRYLDQETLYTNYNFEDFNEAGFNRTVRQSRVSVYICPADLGADQIAVPASGPACAGALNLNYRTGSYRAIAGQSDGVSFLDSGQLTTYKPQNRGPIHTIGVLGYTTERQRDVTDGLSQTLLVGESTTRTNLSFRTFWAYAYAHYSLASVTPQPRILFGDYDACTNAGGTGGSNPCRRGLGSYHPAGINFLYCDGSVRMTSTMIDINLLASLSTIAGNDFIPTSGD